MTEAETIGHLIGFTPTLLSGVSVFFGVVSVYIAALNFFVRRAGLVARAGAFVFFSWILGILMLVMVGARETQRGLVAHLDTLEKPLSAADEILLRNAHSAEDLVLFPGLDRMPEHVWREPFSVDGMVVVFMWGGVILTYVAMFLATFVFKWRGADFTAASKP